jgi:hypothetical protein
VGYAAATDHVRDTWVRCAGLECDGRGRRAPGTSSALSYTVEGRPGEVHIEDFIGGGVAGRDPAIGRSSSRGENARVDGAWIELDTGGNNLRPGVAIYIRIPKAASFDSPTDGTGHLLGNSLCLSSRGEVVAAH